MFKTMKSALAGSVLILGLIFTSASNATVITQTFVATTGCDDDTNFVCGTSGGIVTFSDENLAPNQIKITFDNTTNNTVVGSDNDPNYKNSSVITGIVFNINQDINSISSWTFTDGNGFDLKNQWSVLIDQSSLISPGNTQFDVTFFSGNVQGGIYNAAAPGSNLNNVFPDIATLILTIADPTPYALNSVGADSILRMQRVGYGGEGSLKIPNSSSSSSSGGGPSSSNGQIPEPGTLSLLGVALIGGLFYRRSRRQAALASR